MRIVQVVHGFPPESVTGTELCTYYLSKELVRRGHEVSVFTASPDPSAKRYHVASDDYDGLDVTRISNWFLGHNDQWRAFVNYRVEEKFRNYISDFNPDIVHIQHLLGLSASIIQAIFEMDIPIVLTAHDYWYVCPRIQLLDRNGDVCSGPAGGQKCEWCVSDLPDDSEEDLSDEDTLRRASGGSLLKRLLPTKLKHRLKAAFIPEVNEVARLTMEVESLREQIDVLYSSASHFIGRYNYMVSTMNKVDRIITPSEYTKKKCVGFGFPEGKIQAVYHGLNTKVFTDTKKTASDAVRFAYFGGSLRHKGIDVLLRAFEDIPPSKASLQIFGDMCGIERDEGLERLAGGARVTFPGRYDNSQLPEVLSEVDVVVVPSLWEETFNLVVREAFLAGTPVVASRIGALEEAVEDGVDGFLFQPGNVTELRQKFQTLISGPEILMRLRKGIKPVKDLSIFIKI